MADDDPKHESDEKVEKLSNQASVQDLFQDALERVARLDSSAQFLSVNTQFADLFGYQSVEMIGMSLAELCVSEDYNKAIVLYLEMKSGGRSECQVRVATRQGDEFLINLLLIKGIEKSDFSYFSYCIVDLVEPGRNPVEVRVTKQYSQKENQVNFLNQVFDIIPDAIFESKLADDVITRINSGFTELTGYNKQEVIGHSCVGLNLFTNETQQKLSDSLKENGTIKDTEISYVNKDGHASTMLLSSVIISIEDSSHVFSVVYDIREKELTEELLRKSEEKIRLISDSIPVTISYVDTDLTIQFVNQMYNELFNPGQKEIVGKKLENIITKTAYKKIEHFLFAALQGNRIDFEYQGVEHFPEKFYEMSFVPNINTEGQVSGIYILSNDITDKKNNEIRELQLDKILEQSLSEFFIYDANTFSFIYANKAARENLGYSLGELKSVNYTEINPDLSSEAIKKMFESLVDGKDEVVRFKTSHKRKDGSSYVAEVNMQLSDIGGTSQIVFLVEDTTKLEDAKNALLENEERFRLITMATNDALYDWDIKNNNVWRNDKEFVNCYSTNDHRDWFTIMHPSERDKVYQSFMDSINKKNNYWAGEYRLKQLDGSYVDVYDRAYIMYDDQKKPLRVMGAMTDITDRKKTEDALIISEERFKALYQDNPLMLFSVDIDGIILSLNKHVTDQLGYKEIDILGETVYSIIDDKHDNNLDEVIKTCLSNPDAIQRVELQKKHKQGGKIWVRDTIRAIKDEIDGSTSILIVCEDISENKRLSEQLSFQASHDSLTGLVNRAEFERRLERILFSMNDDSAQHALCYMDLDQFKIVNDTCGHLAGDELLRQISGILNNAVRKRDTLARLGGDEFGILMEHCTLEQAKRVANEMRKYIEEFRYVWEGKRFILGVSIGLVPIQPGSSTNLHSIMREADVACYAAKDAGRNRVHIYTPDDTKLTSTQGQVQWAAIINQALDEERFSLYYQTIKNISSLENENIGEHFEILLRMHDENGQLFMPDAFMPAAERYNLVVKIDTWVFNQVLEWMIRNPIKTANLTMCSINISGHSMNNIQYLDFVLQKLYETNIPPDKICFEITETAAISNISTALKLMQAIKSVGCKFALDDFGSGVSSFAYLKQLPVDFLKIDGTFVKNIVDDQIDYEMVRAINDIARIMGMKTIAEFVENEEVKNKLQEIGVDFAQGYYISEPKSLN